MGLFPARGEVVARPAANQQGHTNTVVRNILRNRGNMSILRNRGNINILRNRGNINKRNRGNINTLRNRGYGKFNSTVQ